MLKFWTWAIIPSRLWIYGCCIIICIPYPTYAFIHLHHMHVNQKTHLVLSSVRKTRIRRHQSPKNPGKGKSIMCKRDLNHNQDKVDMVLGIFLDSMTMKLPRQVAINDRTRGSLKKGNIQKVVAGILPLPPQEQRLLPYQRPAQSKQNLKQKQISKGSYNKERSRPRNDPIPMSYAHLLPILVSVRAVMPKQIEPARFPYHPKHDPNAICEYHVGYVGYYTENCYPFKAKVWKLIEHKLLCFTSVTAEAPIEKDFEYKGPPIHV